MTALALRGILARRTRAILTAIAIVLGVAMISGTAILTDSVDRAFGAIFAESFSGTDAMVSGAPVVDGAATGAPAVPFSLLPQIRALPEVEQASGVLVDFETEADEARLVDDTGAAIGSDGYVFGIDPDADRFAPLDLDRGRWASGPGEIVIDGGTASSEGLAIGDTVAVSDHGAPRSFEITGIAGFGEIDSLGGVTVAVVDVATAQALHDRDGFDAIAVAARPGVSDAELAARLDDVVPAGMRVETGAQRAERAGAAVAGLVDFVRWFLMAFGLIALLVGAFVIANTLSITVAQRTRELATLRTLGATRGQVMRGVLVEAAAVGLAASLAGVAVGVGLARGLSAFLGAVGLGLPEASLRLTPATVALALAAGLGVTLVASVRPALRATRVPPIIAVREGAMPPPRSPRRAAAAGLAIAAASAAALAAGTLGGLPDGARIVALAAGTIGAGIGVAMGASRLIRPLAAIVGWPSARLGGAAGALARDNTVRDPGRTAATAGALMVGLALVSVVAVLGASLTQTARSAIEDQVSADLVLSADDGVGLLPATAEGLVAGAPGVEAVSGVREEQARVEGEPATVNGVDPSTIAALHRFHPVAGAPPAEALRDGGAVVRRSFADEHDLAVGDPMAIVAPSGRTLTVPVAAIDDPPALAPLLGEVVIDRSAFDAAFPRPRDRYLLIAAPGVTPGDLGPVVAGVPDAHVRTRAEFVDTQSQDAKAILDVVYVLLALSIVVSLIGMVNTLVLAVVERTREIGMLRVVGMTRRQVRAMVRHESVITALIGAALGIPLGVGVAVAVVAAMSRWDVVLVVPGATIGLFAAVAVAAGILSAIAPARRAARLRPLEALRQE